MLPLTVFFGANRFCGLTLRGVDVGLLSSVVECSSYDNASEGPDNTLTPTLGIRPERITYWSSKGSPDVNSSEFISYRTISDVALLREIVIQPYAAWFQMVRTLTCFRMVWINVHCSLDGRAPPCRIIPCTRLVVCECA